AIADPTNGTLTDNGDGTWTYISDPGFEGTESFTYTLSDGTLTDTGTITITDPIELWYGSEQTFAAIGEAQTWVNILGQVHGEVSSLSYSLNGGPAQILSVGADTRRLQEPGDFNVEISYSELDGSTMDDLVTITAVMVSGEVFTRDVIIDYEAGNIWTPDYSVDWSTATAVQDVVQVADGTWEIGSDGVRPVDLGYDRLLTLGDRNWDNFELSIQVTPHDLLNKDPLGRDGGGFAIGMLWNGHTDDPVPGVQPHAGWEPGAAFFFSDTDGDGSAKLTVNPTVDFLNEIDSQMIPMEEGLTYNIILRVEQIGLYDRLYSIRVWEEGTAEPVSWTLQGIQTFDLSEAPTTGGIYFNAHYNDVSFGDFSVSEIEGRDIIQGTDGDDVQVAVDIGASNPGLGEIDVFVGGAGADTFVLGDSTGTYYDDGSSSTAGEDDYGFVWDFTSGTDTVQLWGSAQDYVLIEDATDLPTGTAIWRVNGSGPNELVGVLNSAYGLDLNSGDFVFTDLIA
ncbi:MAG: Ig-like domain-containing protein, partial [Pseudomonadota bacterium]